jgi:Trk K+ transport system NAD-binding subunit
MLATFVSSRESEASRQYVELPPDFSLRMVPLPPEFAGKTLAEARLPQTLGARVLEIRRPSRNGEDAVIPGADTLLQSGDVLLLLGPTESIEALLAGKLTVGEAALASRPID